MARLRWNFRVLGFVAGLGLLLLGALIWRWFWVGTASARETRAMVGAAAFLRTHALARDDSGMYFRPLPADLQREFAEQFRDRDGNPLFYDPWEPDGTPMRYDDADGDGFIVYALTPHSSDRTILTSALAIQTVSDAKIDWPVRRWRR